MKEIVFIILGAALLLVVAIMVTGYQLNNYTVNLQNPNVIEDVHNGGRYISIIGSVLSLSVMYAMIATITSDCK